MAAASTEVDTLYMILPLEKNGAFAPCSSPFCTKVLAYYALRDMTVEVKTMKDKNLPPQPKGKWPYVKFAASGKIIGDSSAILEEYELARPERERLDYYLTPERRAVALTVKRTLEESFYWSGMIERRWRDKDNFYKTTVPMYFGMLPCCLPDVLGAAARRAVMRDYNGQGMARHTPEEVNKLAKEDLQAVETLCVGPYYHGRYVSSTDLEVYAFVGHLKFQAAVWPKPESGPENLLTACPKLLKLMVVLEKQLEPALRKMLSDKLG
mmetsp:Transcript_12170/g.28392  ORF Transcript_12170/g.28392 Transcript_12170/m.28392 type:complete len:267 (-) Transcript_12170:266-1066(-)